MLAVRELRRRFGALTVTDRVTIELRQGERLAVIGPNGAGKTTLFNLITGELRPDSGAIAIVGRDATHAPVDRRARLGLGRSFQQNALFAGCTVEDNLALAAITALRRNAVFWRDPARDPDVRERVEETARAVGIGHLLRREVDTLAYGERRCLELALALVRRPRVLLLDEPTAGMSPEETSAVLDLLRRLPPDMAVVAVEHDLDLVFEFAQRVVVLDYGRVVFDGSPEEARASSELREIYFGSWGLEQCSNCAR